MSFHMRAIGAPRHKLSLWGNTGQASEGGASSGDAGSNCGNCSMIVFDPRLRQRLKTYGRRLSFGTQGAKGLTFTRLWPNLRKLAKKAWPMFFLNSKVHVFLVFCCARGAEGGVKGLALRFLLRTWGRRRGQRPGFYAPLAFFAQTCEKGLAHVFFK